MVKEVTLRQAGGSVSATLPKDMADRLRIAAGLVKLLDFGIATLSGSPRDGPTTRGTEKDTTERFADATELVK